MNTQVKHTPGPWHIGMKPGPMIYGQNGEQVADCRCIDLLGRDEAQANLALIAAAPSMYEALQDMYDEACEGQVSQQTMTRALTALAQAEVNSK